MPRMTPVLFPLAVLDAGVGVIRHRPRPDRALVPAGGALSNLPLIAMCVVLVPLMRFLAAELEPMFIARYTMDTPARGKEGPA